MGPGCTVLTVQQERPSLRPARSFLSGALGFSDCLVLEAARKAGHGPLGTFDRELARLDGAELLRERAGR